MSPSSSLLISTRKSRGSGTANFPILYCYSAVSLSFTRLTLLFVYRTLVKQQKYPVVFSHNDMQEGNILIRQNSAKTELVVIDFEYCSYNYRGFDVANHFCEWQYDYTNKNYPFFSERSNCGPTKEQKVRCALGDGGIDSLELSG